MAFRSGSTRFSSSLAGRARRCSRPGTIVAGASSRPGSTTAAPPTDAPSSGIFSGSAAAGYIRSARWAPLRDRRPESRRSARRRSVSSAARRWCCSPPTSAAPPRPRSATSSPSAWAAAGGSRTAFRCRSTRSCQTAQDSILATRLSTGNALVAFVSHASAASSFDIRGRVLNGNAAGVTAEKALTVNTAGAQTPTSLAALHRRPIGARLCR